MSVTDACTDGQMDTRTNMGKYKDLPSGEPVIDKNVVSSTSIVLHQYPASTANQGGYTTLKNAKKVSTRTVFEKDRAYAHN